MLKTERGFNYYSVKDKKKRVHKFKTLYIEFPLLLIIKKSHEFFCEVSILKGTWHKRFGYSISKNWQIKHIIKVFIPSLLKKNTSSRFLSTHITVLFSIISFFVHTHLITTYLVIFCVVNYWVKISHLWCFNLDTLSPHWEQRKQEKQIHC